MTVILLLCLLLPITAFSIESTPQSKNAQLPIDTDSQIASFYKPAETPCLCQAANGLGCSVFVFTGLHSSASGLHAASQIDFCFLQEIALVGNSRQVPLPPPKV